jgi:hypothetical protein
VSAAAASALSAPRWILACVGAAGPPTSGRIGFDVSLWSASGWVVAARIGPGGEGMVVRWQCVARTRVDGRPGPPQRMRTGWGAAFAAWPTKGAGPAPGCRSVGWEYEKEQVLTSPPQVRPEQVAGVMADHRLAGSGDHAPWSLCCVGPWRSAPEGPIRFGGEQAAAAARPRQVRSAVRQELTAR